MRGPGEARLATSVVELRRREFETAGLGTTGTIQGDAREKAIRDKLREVLSGNNAVTKGVVINSYGNASHQTDIVTPKQPAERQSCGTLAWYASTTARGWAAGSLLKGRAICRPALNSGSCGSASCSLASMAIRSLRASLMDS